MHNKLIQLHTYDETWYSQLYFGSKLTIIAIMSYDGLVYYLIFRQWLMSSVLFKRTNIIHNLPVTCNDWHFTNTWKAFGWQHHFANKTSLSPPPFIEVSVSNQKSQR